ncbi:restriction endonuclease [Salegentibacter sp.]|uniref:restriction endonuclease n=1 Tax=Salegentibacter sp. TaxID=1903072 RepID=UPI003569198A
MKKKTGKNFEKLAESIFKKLVKNPEFEKVEHNVLIEGPDGKRQIDVLVKSETVGQTLFTAIECKDYNRKLSVSVLDAFHSKLRDINANKGILISRNGFSSQVISKAKRKGITLCTADETENENWESIIDLPIILEELHLLDFNINIKYSSLFESKINIDSILQINGLEVVEFIKNKWKNDQFESAHDEESNSFIFPEFNEPLTSKTNNGYEVPILSLTITAKIKKDFYLTSTSKVKNTQILNNISEGKKNVFIDVKSIKDKKFPVQKISKSDLVNLPDNWPAIRILPHLNVTKENFRFNETKEND